MNVLDLFSGIGGFSLGLERAGMRTKAFCEIDPYCRRVLRRHWPDVPCYDDVRTLTAARLAADGIIQLAADPIGNPLRDEPRWRDGARGAGQAEPRHDGAQRVDLVCGGFPCQDISVAGKGAGIGGERSGLWSEYARIIGEVRPRYVIVENVAALLGRGLATVLGDLAALGFDAEWHCIPASAVGAPHRRDRLWIVAYPARDMRPEQAPSGTERQRTGPSGQPITVADADGTGRQQQWRRFPIREELAAAQCGDWWLVEPDVGRVAARVPQRVDRLRALGNAVVPQIPEIIGRAIMNIERDDYDANDDFAKSYNECLRVIRERKVAGGKGWEPR